MKGDDLESFGIPRKKLPLFFLIDTSGSMDGSKIATVNQAMAETINEVRNIGGSDADVQISVITFDDECKWMYDSPVAVESFKWNNLTADGMTCLGEALNQLETKLHRDKMGDIHASFAPVLILLSDGFPNDDYISGFKNIEGNKWYMQSLRIALGIGKDFDRGVLERFTGSPELVAEANGKRALHTMIKKIALSSITSGTRTNGTGSKTTDVRQDGVIAAIKDAEMEIDDLEASELEINDDF